MFQKYNRKAIPAEMRPYVPGEELPPMCTVADDDRLKGSPKAGDMIARNPSDHANTWLVEKTYFEEKFEPTPIGPAD